MEHFLRILMEAWGVAGAMAPYLLFGFFMAGVMSVVLSPEWIERHLGGKGIVPVLKAVILGIPLPLCSCSVIPVTASIRRHGASPGATTGFLIATPQTGVDSLIATWGMMGPVFAVFRPLAAFVTGVIGGGLVSLYEKNGDAAVESKPCTDSCCTRAATESRVVGALRYAFVTMPGDIGKELLLGIAVAALISALLPQGLFVEYLGGGFLSMLVMMAVGIPMYVCSTASIPIALGLMYLGASPGAALVFLITGPATNAATIATVRKIMGTRTTVIYLATVAIGSLAAGFSLDAVYAVTGTASLAQHMAACHTPAMPWWQHASAVFLLLLIAGDMLYKRYGQATIAPAEPAQPAAEEIVLQVSGMTCGHCAAAVDRELKREPGVDSVQVEVKTGRVAIRGSRLDSATLIQRINGLGYQARA